jgi:hypothetical protein
VQAHLLLGKPGDGVVDRVDADLRERLVVGDRGLGADLVEVLGERRVVELQDEPASTIARYSSRRASAHAKMCSSSVA